MGRGTFDVQALHVPAVAHGADDVQSAVHVALLTNKNKIREMVKFATNVVARVGTTTNVCKDSNTEP